MLTLKIWVEKLEMEKGDCFVKGLKFSSLRFCLSRRLAMLTFLWNSAEAT